MTKPSRRHAIGISLAVAAALVAAGSWAASRSFAPKASSTAEGSADAIELGKPCDGTLETDSHGYQCYLFSLPGGSLRGIWTYGREQRPLLFYLADDLRQISADPELKVIASVAKSAVQDWKTYESPDGTFSFRYPATWGVMEASSSDTVTATNDFTFEGPDSEFTITYHPNADFDLTDGARFMATIPDDTTWYNASSGAQSFLPDENGHFFMVNHFTLDGVPAVTLEIADQVVDGATSDDEGNVNDVVAYVLGTHGYAEVTYQDSHTVLGLPIDLAIASLRMKQ